MADLAYMVEAAEKRNKDIFLSGLAHCDKGKLNGKLQVLYSVCRNGWLDIAKALVTVTNYRGMVNLGSGIISSSTVPHHGGGASPVQLACTSGNLELVQYFIDECGCYVYECTDDGLSTIHCAIIGGLHIVKYLVEHPDLLAFMILYNSPLTILFTYYNWDNDLMKYLVVECECSIIINESTGDSVLHYACRDGYIARLRFLIEECKCDSRVLNKSKHTLLYTVCSCYHNSLKQLYEDMLMYLTDTIIDSFDIKFELKRNKDDLNTVECAIMVRWEAAVNRLVVLCDDQNDKYRIISIAYYYWDDSIMRYLIAELGIVTNGITGNTLLHNACRDMSLDKIRFIAAEMSDVTDFSDIADKNKNTLLHAFSGSSVCTPSSAVLSYLKPMCKYSINAFNYTPLEWAIVHQTLPMNTLASVRYLVEEYGSDELHGGRVLALAFQHWSDDLIKYLLVEMKCSPVTDVSNGDTILHMACQIGNIKQVNFLIESCNCKPLVKNESHNLLIHAASNNFYILQYLCIECDCYTDLSGHQNASISAMLLAIAQKRRGLTVVKHLVEKCKVESSCEIMTYVYDHWCPDIVKYLIVDAKFDVYCDTMNNTILHLSADQIDLGRLKYLIDTCNCSPHIKNKLGESLIHTTLHHTSLNDFNVLQYLCIDCNWCPNLTGASQEVGTIAMKSAIVQKEKGLGVVKHLVEKCMSYVYKNWCPDIVKYLIVDAKFDVYCDTMNNTILHLSADQIDLGRLKYLIDTCTCNCSPHTKNKLGESLIHTTRHHTSLNDFNVLQYLCIDCNCCPNLTGASQEVGTIAMKSAIQKEKGLGVVKHLVEKCQVKGNCAIMSYVYKNWCPDIVKYLIVDAKFDVYCDTVNNTILHLSAMQSQGLKRLKYLIDTCDCSPHIKNNYSESLIHAACRCHNWISFDVLRYLCIYCDWCPNLTEGNQTVGSIAMKSAIAEREEGLVVVKHLVEKCKVKSSCEIMSSAWNNWCKAVMKYLIVDAKFDLTTDMHTGYTVLHHCVCFNGNFEQMKFLMETCHCCTRSHIETLVPALIQEIGKVDLRFISQVSDFPTEYFLKLYYLLGKLCSHHTVAVDGHNDVAKTVLCCYYYMHNDAETTINLLVKNCVSSQSTNHALDVDICYILCIVYDMWHKDALKCLLLDKKCKMIVDRSTGDTVLHYACLEMNKSKLEFLLEECKCTCDIEVVNLKGETILHTLCTPVHTIPSFSFDLWFSIVQYVIENHNFHNLALQDNSGNTVFHLICSSTKYFKPSVFDNLLKYKYNLNLKNIDGYTVLHSLCHHLARNDPLNVGHYIRGLIQDGKCNPLLKDSDINSILHILASNWMAPVYSKGFLSLIHYLLYDCQLDSNSVNNQGDTVLHVACRNFKGDIALIERIISTGKVDMLNMNNFHETPLMLLDNCCRELDDDDATKQVKQLIDRFGEVQLTHPIHSYVNVVLLGDSEVGKSTLCKVIESRKAYTVVPQFRNVKKNDVEPHTAGIVTKILNDKDIGRIILHDLAGQAEYYSSHTAVLENLLQGSAAVFVAVVSLADANCIKSFHQWFNIIENVSHNALHQCRLIVVASHIDQSVVSNVNQLKQSISDLCSLPNKASKSVLKSHGVFELDCRKLGGNYLTSFISALSKACKSITDNDTREMSLYCHMLYDFFQRNGESSYTLTNLIELSENTNGLFLPKDIKHVESIVSQLSSTGLVVYLKSKLELNKSWVVADKSVLLSELNGVLFAPQDFKQHVQDIASNTGVVKLSNLYSIFPNYDPELLLQFLHYMELCTVISGDSEFLTDRSNMQSLPNDSGQYIFVPALIKSTERPDTSEAVFKFGWCLRCTKHSFFISRFLHLLQLHLACTFSIMKSASPSKFERLCQIWTKGIYWKDTKGVEALVKVADSNQAVIVLMSCEDGYESDMFDLIHDVIAEILSCKQQVMPQVIAHDFIINNSFLQRSLDSLDNVLLYSVQLLASCFLNNDQFVIDNTYGRNRVAISELSLIGNKKKFFHAIFAKRDPNCIVNTENMAEANAHGLIQRFTIQHNDIFKMMPEKSVAEADYMQSTEYNPPIHVGMQTQQTTSTNLVGATPKEPLTSPDVIVERVVEPSTLSPFQILKSHTPQLLGLISDPHKLAIDLWSADLLSDATKDEVETNTSLNRYKKANCVLSEITRLISSMDLAQQMETFEKFCSVLKSQGDPGLERISNQMIADMKTNSTPNTSLH